MKNQIWKAAGAFCLFSGVALAGGSVKGKVTFDGDPPKPTMIGDEIKAHADAKTCHREDGASMSMVVDPGTKGIQYTYVQIRKVKGGKELEVPKAPIVSDQKGCVFHPHMVVVPEGAEVEFKNSDDVLHNTHSWSRKNKAFNQGIPAGKSTTIKFEKREMVKLTCDVHPWMVSWVIVTDTPYYAVTAKDGSYEIKDLPAGEWEVEFWHETLGKVKEKVTIADGKTSEFDVKMKAEG